MLGSLQRVILLGTDEPANLLAIEETLEALRFILTMLTIELSDFRPPIPPVRAAIPPSLEVPVILEILATDFRVAWEVVYLETVGAPLLAGFFFLVKKFWPDFHMVFFFLPVGKPVDLSYLVPGLVEGWVSSWMREPRFPLKGS